MSRPDPPIGRSLRDSADRYSTRRVVMVTSPGVEPSLSDVAWNLATVSAQTGQRVALVSTGGFASPEADPEQRVPRALPWRSWAPSGPRPDAASGNGPGRLLTGTPNPVDVGELLEDTSVPGVSRLNLRHFVGHPAQVVIRVPEVLSALLEVVDVTILEVPSYLTVHHGEGLTPIADVVLVVGERDATTMDQVRRTGAALKRLGAPVIGMALTSAETDGWEVDSEFETEDDRPIEVHERTEPIPVVAPAVPFDDGSAVDHPAVALEDRSAVDHQAVPVEDGSAVDHVLPEA